MLLRSEAGSRATVAVGIADTAHAELDLGAAEAEERGVLEPTTAITGKLAASAVDPEIVVVLEPLRVGQEHDPDAEGIEAELVGSHDFDGPTNGTTGVTLAELAGDNEDIAVFLLFGQCLEHLGGLCGLPDVLGIDLPFAPVV